MSPWGGRSSRLFVRSFVVAALAVVAAGADFGAAQAATRTPARAPVRAAVHPPFGSNLVVNGDFEDALGSLDIDHVVKPNHWSTSGNFTVVQYGGLDGLPVAPPREVPTRPSVNHNFFAGGPDSGESHAWQLINLKNESAQIATGKVRYVLSAYLGGRRAKADYAQVWVRFLDQRQRELCTRNLPCTPPTVSPFVGPVAWYGPIGPETVTRFDRKGATKLKRVSCTDFIPRRAQYALIVVSAFRQSGNDNHGYVDDVSFVTSIDHAFGGPDLWCRGLVDDRDENAFGSGLIAHITDLDSLSEPCVGGQIFMLAALLTFLCGSLIAIVTLPRAQLQGAPGGQVVLDVVDRIPHWVVLVARALAVAVVGIWVFRRIVRSAELFHIREAGCAFRVAGIPVQDWALPSAIFLALIGFITLAACVLMFHETFVRSRPATPPRSRGVKGSGTRWSIKDVLILFDIVIVAWIGGLLMLAYITPSSDLMERLDTALLVVASALGYLWLSMPGAIRRFQKGLRWAIFALLLVPIVQPAIALWNLQSIKAERIRHETERRYFDVVGDRARFSDVLFYSPSSMDDGQSARVVFSAHLLDRHVDAGCLQPRFRAPGFAVQDIVVDPIPPARNEVRWEWIVTPAQSGRQYLFVNVLYSPTCKPYDAKQGNVRDAFETLFSQSDSVWVSAPWFAFGNLATTLPWLGIAAAIVSALVDLFGLHPRKKEPPDWV